MSVFTKLFGQVPTFSEGNCGSGQSFFDLPTWYKYINCDGDGTPQVQNINDVWGIAAGVIDIFLYVAGAAAVLFIIYGGIRFITSQGAPDKVAQARQTLIYAAAGLVIAVTARTLVNYAFGRF